MLELFRSLVLALALIAPGDVGCNNVISKATLCWVAFDNPAYVEYVKPAQIARLRVLMEIKQAEGWGR